MTESFAPDWNDVLRRSRRRGHRARAAQAGVVLAAVAIGVASAYAFGHPVVDFGKAHKASIRQVDEFGSMEVGAPRGMAPGVLPHATRRIESVRIDGKVHTLYVAPTRHGGFCFEWSSSEGGCRASRTTSVARHLDTGGEMGPWGLKVLVASFFTNGDRLVMRFKDGGTADVPFVWVTAPIDAGFAMYRVPDSHRTVATRPVSLALYDGSRLVRKDPISGPGHVFDEKVVRVQGFPPLMLPYGARWSEARQLFDLRAPNRARVGLWAMPGRDGSTCFVTNTAGGCVPPRASANEPRLMLAFNGPRLCCFAGRGIARVEARFQDGASFSLYPREGFLVWPIPADHYAPGHRLVALLGYDASGRLVAHGSVPTPADQRGIYPCKKPKNLGYGVQECA